MPRFFRFAAVLLLAGVLAGCASFNNLYSEVSTYGPWPAQRRPATFVFERLPSQQEHPERREQIEAAARGALETAGFRAVAEPAGADYLVQIGARVEATDPWIYNDPLFLQPYYGWRRGYGYGYDHWGLVGWGPGYPWDSGWRYPTFQREVVLLIRDRQTGQLLYEARSRNSGPSASIGYLLPAMFDAALKDFPSTGPNPRQVTTPISKG